MVEFEESVGNVYRDIGATDPERMLIKAKLMSKIDDLIQARKLTQQRAAEIIGIPQPKLSKMLNGEFRGVSEMKMLECLAKLGIEITISIGEDINDFPKKIEIASVSGYNLQYMEVFKNNKSVAIYTAEDLANWQALTNTKSFSENGVYTFKMIDQFGNVYETQIEKYYKVNVALIFLIIIIVAAIIVLIVTIIKSRHKVKVK